MMPKSRRTPITILSIFVLAFALRLTYLFFLKHHYFFYDHPASDVLYYRQWAQTIVTGQPTGVFWGLPLYPYFLAVLDRLTLGNLLIIRLCHLALGAVNCVLLYQLGRKLFSERAAVVAAVLAALNFRLIYYDWLMMPVTLLIFLSLVIVLSIVQNDVDSPKREWFLTGILIGLAALGDGKFLIYFALLLGYLAFQHRNNTLLWLRRIGVPLTVGLCLVLSLVVMRNRIVGGQWVLITAQSGLSFYVGNNPQAGGFYENPELIRPTHAGQDIDQQAIAQRTAGRDLGSAEVSAFWAKKATDFITTDPMAYLSLLGKKAVLFFGDHEAAYDVDLLLQHKWKNILDFNPWGLIWPLAITGMVLTFRRSNIQTINLLLFSQFSFTLIFFLIERHRITILPFLLLYEACGVFWFFERARNRNLKKIAPAILLLVFYWVLFRPTRLDPAAVEFLYATKAGPVWEKRSDHARARGEYRRALELRPQDSTTRYNLANTYLKEGDHPQAIAHYQKAIELNPYHSDAFYNLGHAYRQAGDIPSAIAAYEKVLALDPGSVDAHYQLAQIHREQNNCQAAQRHYRIIIELAPSLKPAVLPEMENCHPKGTKAQ
jgi:tetratricopeptide (TPR) repeat protein